MRKDNPRKDEDEQRLLVNSFAANSDRYKGFSSCWRFSGSPPQLASFAFRLAPAHKIPFADVTIVNVIWVFWLQTYILKAKKFAEPLFQKKKIAEKVRKSGRHIWAI